jgi:small conductance mechanosensitive channel
MFAASATDACGAGERVWLCNWVANVTDSRTAADVARWLSPWVSIALIALGAYVIARLTRRLLKRAVRRWERFGRFVWWRRRGVLGPGVAAAAADARRHQRAETIGAGMSSFASIVVWTIAAVWMLAVLGIEAATLLTSAGLIGVALAFGAQNLLRDLIAGVFIIFEDQLGVGDVVDLGVASGTVEEVTLRTTRLRDVEGVVWYVPNGAINRVANMSQQWSRAIVDVPVPAGADLDRAREVIKAAADALWHDAQWHDRILAEPEVWGVESFTLETVTIRLVVKTAPSEQWRVARELRSRLKGALDAAGIDASPAAGADGSGPEAPG